jgi:hypothetical protein
MGGEAVWRIRQMVRFRLVGVKRTRICRAEW